MKNNDYRNLKVWQRAMNLASRVYRTTATFPRDEKFGLALQMRRAVTSIPCNLAEGKGRGSCRDFRRFLLIARGSLLELETQALLAHNLGYLEESSTLLLEAEEIGKMINGVLRYVDRQIARSGT